MEPVENSEVLSSGNGLAEVECQPGRSRARPNAPRRPRASMSPSRGLWPLCQRAFSTASLPRATTLFTALSASSAPLQVYISRSHSPHTNLSLEHHLFTTLPAATTTLLFYTNTPSIIIGRNQNPWTETNHPLLLQRRAAGAPALVRRRSGGGTVYHDLGNLNYSVTVPAREFNRDKYAMLMAEALRSLGVVGAAVNVRHDVVVLPPGAETTALKLHEETPTGTRKVSGSAYKITRLRSYHHGTMLLESDLAEVGKWLRSPAAAHIEARGVSSVPSPVANTGVGREALMVAAVDAFEKLHNTPTEVAVVGEQEAMNVESIRKGAEELKSSAWTYAQTPKFELKIPGVGDVVVDKGVVVGGMLEGCVGRRFGGGLVNSALRDMGEVQSGRWAEEVLGSGVWDSVE